MIVLRVLLEMLRQLLNLAAQNPDLHFGASGVGLVALVLVHDPCLQGLR